MDAAVKLLKREIEDQSGKLNALREELDPVIRQGRDAQRQVDLQVRHVRDLQAAISAIEKADRDQQVRVVSESCAEF